MGRLSNVDRHRALGMVEGGLSYRQVAERMGCSHTTIARLVERHNATGSVDDRQRPGRERVYYTSAGPVHCFESFTRQIQDVCGNCPGDSGNP